MLAILVGLVLIVPSVQFVVKIQETEYSAVRQREKHRSAVGRWLPDARALVSGENPYGEGHWFPNPPLVLMALVPFAHLPIVVTAVLRVIRARSEDLAAAGDLSEELGFLWTLGLLAIPFLFSFAAFMFLYTLIPAKNGTLQSAIPGALVAASVFELVKNLFGFYVENFANFDVVFGSMGAVAGFLFWVFISSQIMLFGAELSRAFQTVEHSAVKQGKLKGMGLPLYITVWRIVRGVFIQDPEAGKR